ncbi:MAG: DUF3667 domain-containing protein [Saprospirales bacterium]|nr:MAG: DUF3667 domain-containing protein [Saprospirales bacterium]
MEEKKSSGEFRELAEEFTGLEGNKVLNTLKGLTFRPGIVISNHLKGENRFLSPVIYFFALLTIQFFVLSLTGFLDRVFEVQMARISEAFGGDESLEEDQVSRIVEQFGGFLTFIMSEIGQKLVILPFSLALIWLIYRGRKAGFKSHIWFGLYSFGHIILISTLLAFLWNVGISPDVIQFLTMIITVFYWIFASGQFYQLSRWKAIGLGLLYYLLYFLFFSLVGGLFGIYIGFQLASEMD